MRHPTLPDQLGPFEIFSGHELSVGRPLVARLQGRRFDQLLEEAAYERPYDARFAKAMVKTLGYLCTTLGASFGFVERTEMSLYAVSAGGDGRRLLSRIAGEAAGKLSLHLGQVVTFDAHLYEFSDSSQALEYFRWRQDDAHVSAIDRYCTHVLALSGADQSAVPRILDGLGPDEKVELLRQNALDFQTVPSWQRHGACVKVRAPEADQDHGGLGRLLIDMNLPSPEAGDDFGDYLRRALAQ
ncbi:MAG TPA: tRNA(His) guanylyltransferase Thg1 family protein [Polyangia bacterium]|jgi:tRNA(His) 5'-end guanylyltransferase